MKNNVKAYKLCFIGYGNQSTMRSSAIKHSSSTNVKYVFGRLIRPPRRYNRFLFVFDTQDKAKAFCKQRHVSKNYAIFEVRANNVRTLVHGVNNGIFESSDYPLGTLFCSSLRLKKKVWQRYTIK